MKLKKETHIVEKHGMDTELSISIDPSSQNKLIALLRSNIYSNSLSSCVREILSNSLDANKISGNNQKVKIILPNEFNPSIEFRDFGNSMTKEQMELIYCNFGKSTKTDNNEQIGCFGIGSKSPLAYTDNFNIITNTLENQTLIKRNWIVYIDGDQSIKLSLIDETITDESITGTSIVIPINKNDFQSLSDYVSKYTEFVQDEVEIIGKVDKIESTSPFNGDGWAYHIPKAKTYDFGYFRYKTILSNGSSLAIIGGIPYPIQYDQLKDITQWERYLLISRFCINFEIGELDVTASREEIKYTNSTILNIRKRLATIKDELTQQINTKILNFKSLPEACHYYFSFIPKEIKCIVDKPVWHDVQILDEYVSPANINIEILTKVHTSVISYSRPTSLALGSYKDKCIYINDLGTKRIKKDIANQLMINKYSATVISNNSGEPWIEQHCNTVKLSTIFNQHKVNNPTPNNLIEIYTFIPNLDKRGSKGIYRTLDKIKVDRNRGGVYLINEDGYLSIPNIDKLEVNYAYNVRHLNQIFNDLKLNTNDLVIINNKTLSKLGSDWLKVEDKVDSIISSWIDKELAIQVFLNRSYIANIYCLEALESISKHINKQSIIQQYLSICKKYRDYYLSNMDKMNVLKYFTPVDNEKPVIEKMIIEIQSKYPMMFHVINLHQAHRSLIIDSKSIDDVISYINTMDK